MWTTKDHFFQLMIMLTVILSSQALARRINRKRLTAEVQRVRIALAVGLAALRRFHEDNLDILAGGEHPLMSGRNHINLLRTQLGRLATLEEREVEAVMIACIAAERAETDIAGAGRKVGGMMVTLPPVNEAARQRLESTLRDTCAQLQGAEQLLRPGSRDPVRDILPPVAS